MFAFLFVVTVVVIIVAEAYSEPSHTSKTKVSLKIMDD